MEYLSIFLKFFFSQFEEVSDVLAKCKTGDVEVMITVNFNSIPNVLLCGGRPMYIGVEGRRPLCWAYGASGHLSWAFLGKRQTLESKYRSRDKPLNLQMSRRMEGIS